MAPRVIITDIIEELGSSFTANMIRLHIRHCKEHRKTYITKQRREIKKYMRGVVGFRTNNAVNRLIDHYDFDFHFRGYPFLYVSRSRFEGDCRSAEMTHGFASIFEASEGNWSKIGEEIVKQFPVYDLQIFNKSEEQSQTILNETRAKIGLPKLKFEK